MKTTMLALIFLSAASPAIAAPSCSEIAAGFAAVYADFPAVTEGTVEDLITWRASCAETPPYGPDDVEALCEANTDTGTRVFYWLKRGADGASSGYVNCAAE